VKVWVIGSSGFIGNAIVKSLMVGGHSVISVSRNEFNDYLQEPEVLRESLSPNDSVVCAAAKVPVRSIEDVVSNLEFLDSFVSLFSPVNLRYMLNISSDSIYGNSSNTISEVVNNPPDTLHGITHFLREMYLNQKFSCRVGHIRPTLVYGPSDPHKSYGPNRFIRNFLENKPVEVYGDGSEIRDHIFVDDVGRIATEMVSKSFVGPLTAASGESVSFLEIARLIHRIRPSIQVVSIPRINNNSEVILKRTFDVSRRTSLLPDFKPTTLEKGILQTIQQVEV
jgi:UDP-glucose 4-epimerase